METQQLPTMKCTLLLLLRTLHNSLRLFLMATTQSSVSGARNCLEAKNSVVRGTFVYVQPIFKRVFRFLDSCNRTRFAEEPGSADS